MFSSGYLADDAWAARVATSHDAKGLPLPKGRPSASGAARYASSGGLYATATDYARFLIEVINPKPADSFRLTTGSLQMMMRPVVAVPDDAAAVPGHPRGTLWASGGKWCRRWTAASSRTEETLKGLTVRRGFSQPPVRLCGHDERRERLEADPRIDYRRRDASTPAGATNGTPSQFAACCSDRGMFTFATADDVEVSPKMLSSPEPSTIGRLMDTTPTGSGGRRDSRWRGYRSARRTNV